MATVSSFLHFIFQKFASQKILIYRIVKNQKSQSLDLNFKTINFLQIISDLFSCSFYLTCSKSKYFMTKHVLMSLQSCRNFIYLDIRLFFWFFRLLPSLDICLHLAFSRGWISTMICKTGNIVVSVDFYKLWTL